MKQEIEAVHKLLPTVRAPCREPLQNSRLCGICRISPEVDGLRRCSRVVSESPKMRELLAKAGIVAGTDSTVVISGETGTGKEVVARLIHSNGARQAKPFVAVNVAALPPELLESELFGHVKGAFTGAVTTTHGLFGEADGGTLMLDEIGEMPQRLQAKLLRVLQEGEIRRVGETRARRVNVRVISATHRNLRDLVNEGSFRDDLYYRLKVFSLEVPPLRQREEDVVPLARMFGQRMGFPLLEFTTRARAWLERYAFPGNVRELGNVVEHGVAFARGGPIDLAHLPEELISPTRSPTSKQEGLRSLKDVERDHVASVLSACGNNQIEAARILGIGRSTLWRKLTSARSAPEPRISSGTMLAQRNRHGD